MKLFKVTYRGPYDCSPPGRAIILALTPEEARIAVRERMNAHMKRRNDYSTITAKQIFSDKIRVAKLGTILLEMDYL